MAGLFDHQPTRARAHADASSRHRGTRRGIFAVDVVVRAAELLLRCAVCMRCGAFFLLLDVLTPLSDCKQDPSKRWNGEFRGFRICIGWISTTGFCVVGFYVPDYFQTYFSATTARATTPHRLSFPAITPRATTPIYTTRAITPRAITPRAITPSPPLHGDHACVYISRLSRHSLVLFLGYHTRAITLHTRTSGYHTRHS